MTQVSVLGAGSWGTAFSLVLADAGNDVTLWARREEVCETINQRRENTDYLPGVELPPSDPDAPDLFTAIREQLGLKLEATKGPVEVLVIDSIEMATPD